MKNLAPVDPDVKTLSDRLELGKLRPDFDMDDTVQELKALEAFPVLHGAILWLHDHLAPQWSKADLAAKEHQRSHRIFSRVAIGAGFGAVVLAIIQMALNLSGLHSTDMAMVFEGIIITAVVVSVLMGSWAGYCNKWLGNRHVAERLRMLKFRSLTRPGLWRANPTGFADWKAWVKSEIEKIEKITTFKNNQAMEDWSKADVSAPKFSPQGGIELISAAEPALAVYYRYKRLQNQREYFQDKGRQAGENLAIKMRAHRKWLFFITIGFVVIHIVAEIFNGSKMSQKNPESPDVLEIVSIWGTALAAIVPILSMWVRASSAAFELSRKACCFAAKSIAMETADRVLEKGSQELPETLFHMKYNELFLEQEHREWLRLLLEAEWFV